MNELSPQRLRYYRSKPDLADVPELELEQLIETAKARREDALWIVPLAITGGVLVGLTAIVAALLGAMRQAGALLPGSAWSLGTGGLVVTCAAVWLPAVPGAVLWWVRIRRWLILRSIRRILDKASCPYCGFDLRGLRLVDKVLVRCPECGSLIMLAEHGLTREDLAQPPPAAPAQARRQ